MGFHRLGLFAACIAVGMTAQGPLWAQEPDPEGLDAPERERLELAPTPLLHDWLGLPDWAQLSINYTNEINGNPVGGDRQTKTYTHNVAINSAFSSGFGKE